MDNEFRRMVIDILQRGEELPSEWARFLFPPEKREYELVYHGKEREEDILADTMAVPLQPVRTFGKPFEDTWKNLLIFGDNLQALRTLVTMKAAGQLLNADGSPGIRLVYIDPPFASKQEFKGTQEQKAYQDKIAGAQFIEFLRKRLVLIRELLSNNGSVYVHLDTRKVHYMKVLMDEIFGEGNFVNEIIWKRTSAHSDSSTYANVHDSILFYRCSEKTTFSPQYTPYTQEYINERYRHIEDDGRKFVDGDLIGTGLKGGGYTYEWKGITKNWRCPIETMRQYENENRLYYTRNGTARIKRYLDDLPGMPPLDMWTDIYPVNSQAAERIDYPTQKPEGLLGRIIASSSAAGDIVLDAFAGSGTALAVAEKLGRRWIGIDCGKLAIYTIQKRMLNLHTEIGNRGEPLQPQEFTLYNAGLYDFSRLRSLPWPDWRFFALQLFGCQDFPHIIGGLSLDGKYKGASVLVFDHLKDPGKRIDEETIQTIHAAIGDKIHGRFFIIAPRGVFDFQQDYLDIGGVRYYALRIPYSVIHELHRNPFTALRQPKDENAVNDTVDAIGFDFIRPPQVEWETGIVSAQKAYLTIKSFKSQVRQRGEDTHGGLETFSMLLLDYDYDGEVFQMDYFYFAGQLANQDWRAVFPRKALGINMMAVFTDLHGNESIHVIPTNGLVAVAESELEDANIDEPVEISDEDEA